MSGAGQRVSAEDVFLGMWRDNFVIHVGFFVASRRGIPPGFVRAQFHRRGARFWRMQGVLVPERRYALYVFSCRRFGALRALVGRLARTAHVFTSKYGRRKLMDHEHNCTFRG